MKRTVTTIWLAVGLAILPTLVIATEAGGAPRSKHAQTVPAASPPYEAAMLMDAASGQVLFEHNAHLQRQPASMAKMMLMLIVAEYVRDGLARWEDPITTSRWASKMGGSQVYLKEGEVFTLAEMMEAIVIHSANDASVAVAEAIAGSAEAFVTLMNDRARALGMHDTVYQTVHGLPPGKGLEPDLTSAYDLALLARELVKYPEMMKWSRTKEAPFRNGAMTLRNTNHLVRNTSWIDGLKTGFHRQAGFCVTATGTRNDFRLIAVVMGTAHKQDSFSEAARLLNQGFAAHKIIYAVKKGDVVGNDVPVQRGDPQFVRVVAGGDLTFLAKRNEQRTFALELVTAGELEAPLAANSIIGEVIVREEGKELGRVPAVTAGEVAKTTSWWEGLF